MNPGVRRAVDMPWAALLAALAGAALLGSSLARGAWPGIAVGLALVALALAASRLRSLAEADALARLGEAASRVGDPAFVRPILTVAGRGFDGVAAALARRHDHLVQALWRGMESEEALRAVFQALYGPAILVDASGKVRRINRSAVKALQIAEEEAVGRPFLQVLRDHQIEEALMVTLKQGTGAALDVDVIATTRPARYRVRIEPIFAHGDGPLLGAAVLLFDVTRLRYLEKVRSEFVANVSHELRTPITSIKGFVETLLEDELPEETKRRFLRIVKDEADRLEALIGDLLDLSRLESDTAPLARQDVDLLELVSDVVERLRPQADKKAIVPEIRIPPGLPAVPVDRDMFGQALMNLLDNAIKYTPSGGHVWVEARKVAADYIEISVADDGPGIPSEHVPRIFERFYRVDKARSRAEGGTGLGLAIVRHIVQRHQGSVRVESRLGKGSRFIITLPLHPEETPLPEWEG